MIYQPARPLAFRQSKQGEKNEQNVMRNRSVPCDARSGRREDVCQELESIQQVAGKQYGRFVGEWAGMHGRLFWQWRRDHH
jgi:hypothetical protein